MGFFESLSQGFKGAKDHISGKNDADRKRDNSEKTLAGYKAHNDKLQIPLHVKARTEKPTIYPERFTVPDSKTRWGVPYPQYKPLYFVADKEILEKIGTETAARLK